MSLKMLPSFLCVTLIAVKAWTVVGDISAQLNALTFLNEGSVGWPGENLTLLTQCAGFSEDTVQVRGIYRCLCLCNDPNENRWHL